MIANPAIVEKELHAILEQDPRVNLHEHPVAIAVDRDHIALEGEVGWIGAKRRALQYAGTIDSDARVIDRLRVAPAERKGDGEVRDRVCAFILSEQSLNCCSVRARVKGAWESLRSPAPDDERCGAIDIAVADGVVTLSGHVISLAHKRFTGVLAWWAPGTRDIVNDLEVIPRGGGDDDNDDEITDAVRLALEKDPLIDADQIRVVTRNGVVMLQGLVVNEQDKDMAEWDAWYVLGVKDVANRIEVAS